MNTNRIFLGNVMCDKEFIGTMVLLKCKDDLYVALDNIDTIMDVYKINHNKSTLLTLNKLVLFSLNLFKINSILLLS